MQLTPSLGSGEPDCPDGTFAAGYTMDAWERWRIVCLAALSVEDIEDIYLFGTMITGILLIILETKMDRECSLQNWNAFTRPKDKTILSFSGSPTQWPWQGCCWNLPRESNAVRRSCFLPPPYRHSDIAPPPTTHLRSL